MWKAVNFRHGLPALPTTLSSTNTVRTNANLISNDNDECDIFNNAALSDITVEMKIIKEQSLADVERLVKELPAVQQEVVYMRFYQNLSFKEIAEATGVSINTALGRMRYGLINLRRMVEERGIVLTLY